LNFWIDFLDSSGDIGKYSTRAIGQRPKNVNDSDVTSIYYRKVPNLILVDPDSTYASILNDSGT
jgi:hypothetical protein